MIALMRCSSQIKYLFELINCLKVFNVIIQLIKASARFREMYAQNAPQNQVPFFIKSKKDDIWEDIKNLNTSKQLPT